MNFEDLNLLDYKFKKTEKDIIGTIYKMGKTSSKIVSRQLIYPSRIIYNLEEETYKIELKFIIHNKTKTLIVDKETISNKNKIISLSNYGINVSTSNSILLVEYINDIITENYDIIPKETSVSRAGWVGNDFVPFSGNIVFDGEFSFKSSFKAISKPVGEFTAWKDKIQKARKNIVVRLIMDAAFASPMLEFTGSLPFVVLIWGGTGLGKTVALKVAASIWGNPDGTGLINNLDSTTNFIYRTMAFYHNIPTFFDELQVFRGNKNQLIMTITQGIDRGKADKEKGNKKKDTWKNVAIFTGEESISTANSGGGTLNRLIEIYLNQPLFEDCMDIVEFVKNNYGFAGRKFIEHIQQKGRDYISDIYKKKLREILSLGKTADKQASSMANILTADALLNEFMFDEPELTVDDIKDFLAYKEEIDVSERAYDYFIDEIIKYSSYFVKVNADSTNVDETGGKREFWGSFDLGEVMIIRSQFDKMMRLGGFDPKKTTKEWADKGYLMKNTQNKYNHQTSINGLKGNFLKIKAIDREKEEKKKNEKKEQKQKTVDVVNNYKGTNYTQDDLFMDIKMPW